MTFLFKNETKTYVCLYFKCDYSSIFDLFEDTPMNCIKKLLWVSKQNLKAQSGGSTFTPRNIQ